MKKPDKEKEEAILRFLRERSGNGIPPTVREIGSAVGISSTSTVQRYLERLRESGLIEKAPGRKRTLKLSGSENTVQVPVLGKITAGLPILAQEDYAGTVPFPAGENRGELFALSVKGDSMTGAGILNGDYIVAEKNNAPENGDIVVALLEDEATVKRFFREKDGSVRLQPENPAYAPMIGKNIVILGKVISVIRYYRR